MIFIKIFYILGAKLTIKVLAENLYKIFFALKAVFVSYRDYLLDLVTDVKLNFQKFSLILLRYISSLISSFLLKVISFLFLVPPILCLFVCFSVCLFACLSVLMLICFLCAFFCLSLTIFPVLWTVCSCNIFVGLFRLTWGATSFYAGLDAISPNIPFPANTLRIRNESFDYVAARVADPVGVDPYPDPIIRNNLIRIWNRSLRKTGSGSLDLSGVEFEQENAIIFYFHIKLWTSF